MSEYKKKIKRQLEIIGNAISSKNSYSTFDLADKFAVEELTIKRDLREIRSQGIDIHSSKKKGISILSKISEGKLKELILEYISFSYSESFHDKATSLLIKKHGVKSLSLIIQIQEAIELSKALAINYHSKADVLKKDVLINPIRIFQSGNDWRILAINDDIMKQYILSKIEAVKLTTKSFTPISNEKIDSMFRFSLRSWVGQEHYDIKIKFSKKWADFIKEREYIETQKITDCGDGSIIYEATVNSLAEAATWVISFGQGVRVLEPLELKKEVIRLAKEVISNY
ncbi:MAG: transcriptional regulator [Bacteroidetes bacterium]|nr:transcriptional regulator [Bacteroidota bacterium]MBU2586368.1 transcriptional regulator [Bacteroidota bacterium]